MVGYYTYYSYYLCKYNPICIQFVNLLYPKTVKAIVDSFREEKRRGQDFAKFRGWDSYPVKINNDIEGWFLNLDYVSEISFGFGGYDIAVGSYSPYKVGVKKLQSVISNLNIW